MLTGSIDSDDDLNSSQTKHKKREMLSELNCLQNT